MSGSTTSGRSAGALPGPGAARVALAEPGRCLLAACALRRTGQVAAAGTGAAGARASSGWLAAPEQSRLGQGQSAAESEQGSADQCPRVRLLPGQAAELLLRSRRHPRAADERQEASKGSRTPQRALGVLAGGRDGLVAMQRKGLSVIRSARTRATFGGSALAPTGSALRHLPAGAGPAAAAGHLPAQVCTKCGQPWRRSTRPVSFREGRAAARGHSCRVAVGRRPGPGWSSIRSSAPAPWP